MSIDVNVTNDLVIVTETTEDIVVNVSNAAGSPGVGVPVGGTTNQVLKKLSATNYDTYWAVDNEGVPYSGASGNVNLGAFSLTATSLIKSGGTSSQFLKADGSSDSTTYTPSTRSLTINGTAFDLSADRSWSVGTVTSVNMSVPTGLTISGNPITSAGTLALALASGYSIPTTASQATWDAAYNDKINSAAVTGTTTKTLTLNQQDGGTVTASWSDIDTGLTSVGLTMPSAFSVANSPLTSNGTLAVTGAGLASQYIRGDGALADFPTTGGGGSSVSYYLNGSVNQGTLVGNVYYEINKTPILGAGTDFTINADGYIAQFITDANDPDQIKIPAGNWNFELYFSASSNGGSPTFYVELSKYNGTTFTAIASSSAIPKGITFGTSISSYHTTLAVPETVLLATDRLAVRVYVVHSGRIITMHTEGSHLSEIVTTFSTGLNALNGLTDQVQYFATGTSGTDFAISSATDTHTFNLPIASGTNTGKLSNTDWTTFNNKQNTITNPVTGTGTTNYLPKWTSGSAIGNSLVYDNGMNVGIGTTSPTAKLDVVGAATFSSGVTATEFIGNNNATITANNYSTNSTVLTLNSKGTVGVIAFQTSSTERARITAAGRLLLGTTTESTFILDVNGTARVSGQITGNSFVPTSSTIPTNGMYLPLANTLGFATNSTLRATLDTSGNLGLGVTPSAWSSAFGSVLQFKSAGSNGGGALTGSGGSNFRMFANTFYDGSYKYIVNGAATQYEQDGYHAWLTAPSGTAGNAITFTQAMTLSSAGNLLVGTSTDAGFRMSIHGPDGTSYVKFTSPSATTGGRIGYNGNELRIDQQENADLVLRTNGSTRLTIASTGAATFSSSVTAGGITSTGTNAMVSASSSTAGLVVRGGSSIGTASSASGQILVGVTSAYRLSLAYDDNTGYAYIDNLYDNANSNIYFRVRTNGTPINALTLFGTGAATFSSSVTATNEYRLKSAAYPSTYNTSLRSDGSAAGILQFGNNNDNYILAGNTAANGYLDIRVNCATESITAGTLALRFTSGGNILIGTTTDSGEKLQVSGSMKVTSTLFAESNITFSGFIKPSSNVGYGVKSTDGAVLQEWYNGLNKFYSKVNYTPMATPSSPSAGDVYYDSTSNKLRCYNGTSWNDLF